jgi:hypothetical protein
MEVTRKEGGPRKVAEYFKKDLTNFLIRNRKKQTLERGQWRDVVEDVKACNRL